MPVFSDAAPSTAATVGTEIGLFITALLVWAGCWVLGSVLYRVVAPRVLKRIDADKHPAVRTLVKGFTRPVNLYLKLAGLCIALLIIAGWQPETSIPTLEKILTAMPAILYKVLRIGAIVCVTWGLVASSSITALLLRETKHKLDLHVSKSVTRFLAAIFNVVVILIAVAAVLSELNYDVNGIIAGLGLGGLTIALAAQDSASNFFGGLVLVSEKPFEIGDWIVCDTIEGTVEDINLRSTSIRTGPGALTIVPNSKLAGAAITNWSGGMEQRRADFTLTVTYAATRDQLRAYCSAVRTMLETDPEVVSDSVLVRLSDLANSGLAIRVMFYTQLPGMADHLRIRERVNYALLELAEKNGIIFAYPSSSIYLEKGETESPASPAAEPNLPKKEPPKA